MRGGGLGHLVRDSHPDRVRAGRRQRGQRDLLPHLGLPFFILRRQFRFERPLDRLYHRDSRRVQYLQLPLQVNPVLCGPVTVHLETEVEDFARHVLEVRGKRRTALDLLDGGIDNGQRPRRGGGQGYAEQQQGDS